MPIFTIIGFKIRKIAFEGGGSSLKHDKLEEHLNSITEVEGKVEKKKKRIRDIREWITVNGVPQEFIVDTGAQVSTITEADYDQRMGTLIKPTKPMRMTGIGGKCAIIGRIKNVEFKNAFGVSTIDDLIVLPNSEGVDSRELALLGINSLLELRIMKYVGGKPKRAKKKKKKGFRAFLRRICCCS